MMSIHLYLAGAHIQDTGETPHDSRARPHLAGLNVIDRRGRNLGRDRELLLRQMTLLS